MAVFATHGCCASAVEKGRGERLGKNCSGPSLCPLSGPSGGSRDFAGGSRDLSLHSASPAESSVCPGANTLPSSSTKYRILKSRVAASPFLPDWTAQGSRRLCKHSALYFFFLMRIRWAVNWDLCWALFSLKEEGQADFAHSLSLVPSKVSRHRSLEKCIGR